MRKEKIRNASVKAILLVLLLSFAPGRAAEVTLKGLPGETVTVPVQVESNLNMAVGALLKLEYDHDALELVPSDFVRNDTALVLDLKGIKTGQAGEVTFRLNEEAGRGRYPVHFVVTAARDYNEGNVNGPEIGEATVVIGKKKSKPKTEYYTKNGKAEKRVELNSAGNVQTVTYYDRYGNLTRTEESEAWDADGNITLEKDYYPWMTDTDTPYTYAYTYDRWGNAIASVCYDRDGALAWKSIIEYDELDHRTKVISYDMEGKVTGTSVDFVYDKDDHVVSYTRLKADGQVDYYTVNTWLNGIEIESTDTDSGGRIVGRSVYDPDFGDLLYSDYRDEEGHRYFSQYDYRLNSYEEDYRSYSDGYRTVTTYGADGKQTASVTYRAEPETDQWQEQSRTEYVVNDAGNKVETTVYKDGSRWISEKDKSGKMIKSLSYNEDGGFSFGYAYEYDAQGQEIRRNRLTENGSVESYEQMDYDRNGNKIKSISYQADGTFKYGYTYEYNSSGQQTRSNWIGENGEIKSYNLYEYDENGNKVRDISYRGDGTYDGYTEYEYDEAGNNTHHTSYRADHTKSYESFSRKLEDGTYQHRTIFYNSDGTEREDTGWQ